MTPLFDVLVAPRAWSQRIPQTHILHLLPQNLHFTGRHNNFAHREEPPLFSWRPFNPFPCIPPASASGEHPAMVPAVH
jgi:hypothetical protein